MSILTISAPDLLKYGLISMIWKVNNDVGADPLHLSGSKRCKRGSLGLDLK